MDDCSNWISEHGKSLCEELAGWAPVPDPTTTISPESSTAASAGLPDANEPGWSLCTSGLITGISLVAVVLIILGLLLALWTLSKRNGKVLRCYWCVRPPPSHDYAV